MTAAATAPPRQTSDAGDISAVTVWVVCALAYAILIIIAVVAPGVLVGNGLQPGTNEPSYELGLIETSQNIILLASAILAGRLALSARETWLRVWLWLITLGSIVLLGEETSWGQHYFGWATEGWFAANNDQSETNLHNTEGGWFDQKPRNLLYLGMIVGAIVHPLVKLARKGRGLIDNPWWLAPTIVCMAPVVFAFIAGAPKAIDKLAILPFQVQFYRASEMEECFMYAFFVVYLLSLGARLKFRHGQT